MTALWDFSTGVFGLWQQVVAQRGEGDRDLVSGKGAVSQGCAVLFLGSKDGRPPTFSFTLSQVLALPKRAGNEKENRGKREGNGSNLKRGTSACSLLKEK